MLALAYMDSTMYGKALEALEEAIKISPELHTLFVYRAVCAGRFAKALHDEVQRAALFRTAEDSYLRAINLDPTSTNALYGLGILYTYELERPEETVPLMEKILAREKRNVDALFLLAASQYFLGNTEAALDAYDQIIAISDAGSRREEARKNKRVILEGALR
ncbi:MAG: tetratricopeptide repeat protein [Spirochaetales bacterium]|nr:tetratricopeptide repeat protein [Spirochaetales bacterium]